MKRAFKYRFYPTDAQAAELSRTFGCVRLVYNRALAERTTAWFTEQRRINYNQASAALTEWKKDPDLAFLNEVSSVPPSKGFATCRRRFGTSSTSAPATRGSSPARSPRRRRSTPGRVSSTATGS